MTGQGEKEAGRGINNARIYVQLRCGKGMHRGGMGE